MTKKSRLKKCPYCGVELHARGMASHIAFKHPNTQMPPQVENPSSQQIETRATPSREVVTTTQTPKNLDIQPKFQLSVRSEPAEVIKQPVGGVNKPAKPTSDWKLLAWIVGLGVVAYYLIPEVRESFQQHWRGESYDRRKRRV